MEQGTQPSTLPNPCNPSPCGLNSQCQVVSGQARCSCQPNMIGTAPDCRPECTQSSDCSSDRACINQKCVDPCPGSCSLNSDCRVVNHTPACRCKADYTGNGFSNCELIPINGKEMNLIWHFQIHSNRNFLPC